MPWPQPGEAGRPVEILEAMSAGTFSYSFTAHAIICRGRFCKYTAVCRMRHAQTGEHHWTKKARQKLEAFVPRILGPTLRKRSHVGMLEIAEAHFSLESQNSQKTRDTSRGKKPSTMCFFAAN